jgi:hypothetical protein
MHLDAVGLKTRPLIRRVVGPDTRRKRIKRMKGSITKSVVASAAIFLLIVTGSVFSLAAEKAAVSKVVFYVA